MSDLVTIQIQDHIADVRLNRPDKMNAVTPEMWQAIGDAGESLIDNREIRAVVLSGEGRSFCAGLDMASFQAMEGNDDDAIGANDNLAAIGDRPENLFQRAALVWKRVPVPVICSLHGAALGAGAQIALGADIRIAAPDVKFSILEIKWGLIPDIGISQTLRNLVTLDVAKELTFTGRVLDGAAAKEFGLVTRVESDPYAASTALAAEIASKSPDAIRSGKRLLDESWYADAKTGLALEAQLQSRLLGSKNQVESIKANFEKREPQFDLPEA